MNSEEYKCCAFDVGAGLVSAQNRKKYNVNPVGACIARPKKYKYYERGITLIALIITIIIMLILAGVVLNLSIGEHGIFKLAQNAGKNYTEAEKKEQEKLDKLYKELGLDPLPENTKDTKAGTPVQMPKSLYRETPVKVSDKTGVEIVKTTLVASVEALSDGEENTIPIPKGFYYVGGTKNSGVVISDNPQDKNKFAGQSDVPAGASYNEDGTVNIQNSDLKGNQFVWIPCEISNYKKTDFGLANGGWLTTTPTSEEIQVQKYGGFYIARYEAGTSNIKFKNQDVKFEEASTSSSWKNGNFASSNIESGNITCKAGEIPYYYADYYTAVEMSKKMYNTEYVRSMLITGTMWDVTLNYILTGETEENPIDLKNSPWGNYNTETISYEAGKGRYLTVNSSSGTITQKATVSDVTYKYGIRTSASSEQAKKKNIYDLAGNLWEWTEEQSYVNGGTTNLYRGGSFQDSFTFNARPVCYRAYDVINSTNTNVGFRAVLYIK